MTGADARQGRHRSGGPRPDITAAPLDLADLPESRAVRAVAVSNLLPCPTAKGARLELRPWQEQIIETVLAPGVRAAVVAVPRGNGKSTLAAALGLWALIDGPPSAQVPIVAGVSERQARIAFNTARRMVELAPALRERVQVFQDKLYMPHHDASLFPLPAEPDALLGANPTLTIVDELGVVTEETFDAMRLATGKRAESLLLAIGTPPSEPESVMRNLVEHGREGDDPTLALVEYQAPAGCPVDDREAWKVANPALGDFLHSDSMATEAKTVRESTFRQFRLGQWPTGPLDQWMSPDLWRSRTLERATPDNADVVLALDGSFSQDTTALVASSVGDAPHLDVVDCWEPDRDDYRVDVLDVENVVREACRRWHVLEITADPFRWQRSLAVLADERLPVTEYPQSPARLTPATQGLFEAVVNGTVTHSGDKRLARHVANAVLKVDTRGSRLVKESKHSKRHIDLAVAAVMAYSRAVELARRPAPSIYVG